MGQAPPHQEPVLKGRYLLADVLASGGMATVHVGRLLGEVGFARTVAIKRLHAQFVHNADFVSMFLDEARVVARIRHPNVVPTLDVVSIDDEVFIVMDLVIGESLSKLNRAAASRETRTPISVTAAIVSGMLRGLHAAHEARDEHGQPLHVVHRDVTPHNVLVGADGSTRLIDFGIAKATGQLHATRQGQLKGKIPYMAPEQIHSRELDRRVDVYAAGVVLWESLTGRKLFQAADDVSTLMKVLEGAKTPPSAVEPSIPAALDAVVMRALAQEPDDRFATAREMARALEAAAPVASPHVVGEWVEELVGPVLAHRAELIRRIEASSLPTVEHGGRLSHTSLPPGPSDETSASQPSNSDARASLAALGLHLPPQFAEAVESRGARDLDRDDGQRPGVPATAGEAGRVETTAVTGAVAHTFAAASSEHAGAMGSRAIAEPGNPPGLSPPATPAPVATPSEPPRPIMPAETVASQISAVHLVTDPPTSSVVQPPRFRRVFVGVVAACLAAVALWVSMGQQPSDPSTTAGSSLAAGLASAPAGDPGAPLAPRASAEPATSSSSAGTNGLTEGEGAAGAGGSAGAGGGAAADKGKNDKGSSKTGNGSRGRCANPYTRTRDGVIRVRPECL